MKAFIFLIGLIAVPAFAQSAQAASVPLGFEVSVSSFGGRSYRAELTSDGQLLYADGNGDAMQEKVAVSDRQWKTFRKQMDRVGAWEWESEYVDPNLEDGTVWKVDIDFGDKRIFSSGSNRYPPEKQFKAFMRAVGKLLGGREFK